MNPFDNLRPMPPSPCGCAPRPWPRPAVPVPITPQMQPHWAEELRRILDGKQDTISDLDDIREGAQAGATAYQKPEDGVPKSDLEAGVQASLDKADTAVQPNDIAGFVDGAEYDADYGDPPKPTILLKHGDEVVATVDAADFVIDGMVSDVKIENGNLVITFNTDSGKQPITIPLTDIFDPANYYDKDAVNALLNAKQDALTFDNAPTTGSNNPVKSGGIWSAIWGALASLPTGFISLYDWCVAQIAKLRDKLDLNVYGYGNASVTFPDGFSVVYGGTYTAPSGGETVTFIGPVPSSNPFLSGYKYYYPSYLGTLESFTPSDYTVWCLVCKDNTTPAYMMYRTGPTYDISNWESGAPTLTLNKGEASGGHPTMARPLGATGDTLAKASQLAGKLDKSGGTVVGTLGVAGPEQPELLVFEVVPSVDGTAPTMRFGDGAGVIGIRWRIAQTSDGHYNIIMEAGNELGESRQITLPFTAGTLALTAGTGHAGNLAALDASGNPTDSLIPAANVALKGAIPYALVTKTISNNVVTLDDRAINAVAVSSSLASLTVNFPTATSGKVRDFGLRLTVASGITTAPQLALPQGVVCENADGEAPEIGADGAATILYFTETASGVFLVKGEVVTAIS